jgi:hypothetical protein
MTNDDYFGAVSPRQPTVSETVNQTYAAHPPHRNRSLDSTLPSWRAKHFAFWIGRMIAGFFDPL